MTEVGGIAGDRLRLFVGRIERLEQEEILDIYKRALNMVIPSCK